MEERIVNIIDKYLSNAANAEEKAEVEALLEVLMEREALTINLSKSELENISIKMWREIVKSTLNEKENSDQLSLPRLA